jgi:hypothetical protein
MRSQKTQRKALIGKTAMTTMQDCMWCSRDIGTTKGRGKTALCGCCMEHFSLRPDGPMQKHLDGLFFPVLGIELYAGKHMITRVVNRSACAWLNKEPVEIIQHLTGNVIGCVHARLPEGCGCALPCETCEVLRSVAGTVKTGESLIAVPSVLLRENAGGPPAMVLRLTTMKAGGLVMLRLDTHDP